MRKTFLKVALFSLVAAPMVTSLQSCNDYDDDITEINRTTGTLNSQIKDLEGQIQTLKTALATAENEAKTAAADAENARKQAEQALKEAAAAMEAARAAQAAGDAAKAQAEQNKAAAAKAEADAAAALAMANEAKFAAAQAKADAIAEATRQAEALRNDINNLQTLLQGKIDANAAGVSANAKEIAINAAAIKANVEKLNALEAKIAAIDAKLALYPTTEAMTKAINDAVAQAQAALMAELQKTNTNVADINNKLNTLNSLITSEIAKLQEQIDKILDDLAKNGGDISKLTAGQKELLDKYNNLDGQVNALTGRVDVVESDVAGLKVDVQNINASLTAIQADITAKYTEVLAKIAEVESRTTQIEQQLAALELYKKQLETNFNDIANQFAALESKYGELQTELGNIKGQLNTQTTEINNITSQLSSLQSELGTLKGEFNTYKNELDKKFSTLETNITSSLKKAIQDMQTSVNTKISELENKFTTLETALNTKIDTKLQELESTITELQGALNVLNMLPGRLTAVSMIPELYVAGVPTIEFPNISFNEWSTYKKTEANAVWVYKEKTTNTVTITSNKVVVKYRLNPESITAANVNLAGLEFVSHKAVSVSRAAAESPLKIEGSSVANGELSVTVSNNAVGQLSGNDASTNKPMITVAALKVPIAEKYLYESEKTTGAAVYSDYARVAERGVSQITIVPVKDGKSFAAGSYNYNTTEQYVVDEMPYVNASLDLTSLIRASYYVADGSDEYKFASVAELAAWGLTPKFTLIEVGDYEYAKLEGSVLTPVVPEGKDVKDLLGKKPVFAVALTSASGSIADVKYFQVKFITDKKLPDIVINENIRHIGFTTPQYWNYRWEGNSAQNMTAQVLSQVTTGTALTPDQFNSIYGAPTTCETYLGTVRKATPMIQYSASGENALTFTYTSADLALIRAFGDKQVFSNKVVFTPNAANKDLYPVVTIIYNFTIDVPASFKPELGNYNDLYWSTETGVQTIKAVPLDPAKAGDVAHPNYKTNILNGRTAPYVVFNGEANDSINSIAQWNLTRINTYVNNIITNSAAQVENTVNNTNSTAAATLIFDVDNTSNGKELVSNGKTVEINWNVFPIGKTSVQNAPIAFAKTAVKIVEPLYLNKVNNDALKSIVDGTVTTIDMLPAFNVTDYYGNKIYSAGTNGKKYNDYYDVTMIYDVAKATVGNDLASALGVELSVIGDKLTYDPAKAPAVETTKEIVVPFTLRHYWGELTGEVKIKLEPKK